MPRVNRESFRPVQSRRRTDRAAMSCRSPFHLGLGAIVAAGNFLVPLAVTVFPGNGARLPWHMLFGGGALRRAARRLMRGKCFGERAADLIGPAAVMFDDAIDDLGHG